MLSMHKLTVGDGYAYLTRHVAAGDAGLPAGESLAAYYEHTGNPLAVGSERDSKGWATVGCLQAALLPRVR
ncbi:hypothetical protein [uncultured Cellulomonas sp.]|uniref:hypothetical protein n=1 Tax=uncultured Cellulomonas sp. TaxID=189682 RepID=UPI0028EBBE65|nr:hypothetical protein [uncultured Cellulomonas sp.]